MLIGRLAWCILKCLPLFDDMLSELPWTYEDLKTEAKKVESHKFFWVGQLGSTKQQMNEVLAKRYVHRMWQSIKCEHGRQRYMCKECRGSGYCVYD